MSAPPDWIVRTPTGSLKDEYVLVPLLEWDSRSGILHGQRVKVRRSTFGITEYNYYDDAPLIALTRWHLWGHCTHFGASGQEWHPTGTSIAVCPPRTDGEIWRCGSRERSLTIPEFDRITALIARNISDGYDFDALRAALVDATRPPAITGDDNGLG